MKPLTAHTGRAVVLRRSDVDTDQICPAKYCKRITKSGYDDALFSRWRESDPEFPLNRPGADGATVLLSGQRFGTGSSREHAVWALRDWGLAAVVAESFGDIFRRNALKNGLLAIVLDAAAIADLMAWAEADPELEITVDLQACQVRAKGAAWGFEIDERARWLLLNGLDDIEDTLRNAEDIARYESRRAEWLPTIVRRESEPVALTGTGA